MNTAQSMEYPIILEWEEVLNRFFELTEKFPKRLRFTLSARMEDTALEVFTNLIEAKEAGQHRALYPKIAVKLETLRLLLRLVYTRKFINLRAYESMAETLLSFKGQIEAELATGLNP